MRDTLRGGGRRLLLLLLLLLPCAVGRWMCVACRWSSVRVVMRAVAVGGVGDGVAGGAASCNLTEILLVRLLLLVEYGSTAAVEMWCWLLLPVMVKVQWLR